MLMMLSVLVCSTVLPVLAQKHVVLQQEKGPLSGFAEKSQKKATSQLGRTPSFRHIRMATRYNSLLVCEFCSYGCQCPRPCPHKGPGCPQRYNTAPPQASGRLAELATKDATTVLEVTLRCVWTTFGLSSTTRCCTPVCNVGLTTSDPVVWVSSQVKLA